MIFHVYLAAILVHSTILFFRSKLEKWIPERLHLWLLIIYYAGLSLISMPTLEQMVTEEELANGLDLIEDGDNKRFSLFFFLRGIYSDDTSLRTIDMFADLSEQSFADEEYNILMQMESVKFTEELIPNIDADLSIRE